MSAAAELWVRGALLGIDRAAGKKEFADGDIGEIEVLPFEEALDYMKKRAAVGRGEYYALSDKLRFRAFTVSRIADGDLLEKSKGMLAEAIRSGESLAEFWEKTKSEILAPGGMAPGDGWYWETVYRTNLQTAYGAGNAMGFEDVPPIALEFLGIEDERQTEECRRLSDPPVVLPYRNPFWRTHWPPLHFNCRSTLRAIYDEAELPASYQMPPEGAAPAEGFGAYPLDGDSWWQELPAMKERAERYGVQEEIREAAEKLRVAEAGPREYKTVSRELKEDFQNASNQIFHSAPAEQKEAAMEYTGSKFVETNGMLYAKDGYYQRTENKELLSEIKTRVRRLDKIIKEYTLTDDIIAWRGTEAEYYTGWEAGQTYELPGYVSTCVDKGNEIVSSDFIIEMRIKKGTRGMYLGKNSVHPEEDEFLLGRGRKYTVIEKTKSSMILEASND
jgi:hypothetical protein